KLRTNGGQVFDPLPAVASAARVFARHDELRQQGIEPLEAVHRAYWPQWNREDLLTALDRTFTSLAGKAFWKRWRAAGAAGAKLEAAREFDDSMGRQSGSISLQELFLRNMLQ